MKTAVIGGTGMLKAFSEARWKTEERTATITPYGSVVKYHVVRGCPGSDLDEVEFALLNRHWCTGQWLPPSLLNREDYMYVLMRVYGAQDIFASSAGGVVMYPGQTLQVGDLVTPRDSIDLVGGSYTFMRPGYTHPEAFFRPGSPLFCPYLQKLLSISGSVVHGGLHANSILGPGLETGAEINRLIDVRADIAGMPTAYPEARLAIEGGVPYGLICGLTNETPSAVGGADHADVMARIRHKITGAILGAIVRLNRDGHPQDCLCRQDPSRQTSVFDILGDPSVA